MYDINSISNRIFQLTQSLQMREYLPTGVLNGYTYTDSQRAELINELMGLINLPLNDTTIELTLFNIISITDRVMEIARAYDMDNKAYLITGVDRTVLLTSLFNWLKVDPRN